MGKEPVLPDVPKLPPFRPLIRKARREALELNWMACCVMCSFGTTVGRVCVTRWPSCAARNLRQCHAPQMLFRLGTPGEGEDTGSRSFCGCPCRTVHRTSGSSIAWRSARRFHDHLGRLPEGGQRRVAAGIQNHYADLYHLRGGRARCGGVCALGFCNQAAINTAAILLANPAQTASGVAGKQPYKSSRAMRWLCAVRVGLRTNAMGVVCDLARKGGVGRKVAAAPGTAAGGIWRAGGPCQSRQRQSAFIR